MLKIKKVNYKDIIFYDNIHIVNERVNFIIGKSGSGKSTLLKLFNKTENYTTGEILYNGKNIEDIESIKLRKEIKLVSQTTFLFPGTIKDNFVLFFEYCDYPILTDEQMEYFLKLTEAEFSLDTSCDNLSGGEKQRVYIAICLSMKAKLIMLDEPTSALDYNLSVKVLSNIVSYVKEKGLTLIIISHDNNLVELFAENVVNLTGGKINE